MRVRSPQTIKEKLWEGGMKNYRNRRLGKRGSVLLRKEISNVVEIKRAEKNG